MASEKSPNSLTPLSEGLSGSLTKTVDPLDASGNGAVNGNRARARSGGNFGGGVSFGPFRMLINDTR